MLKGHIWLFFVCFNTSKTYFFQLLAIRRCTNKISVCVNTHGLEVIGKISPVGQE